MSTKKKTVKQPLGAPFIAKVNVKRARPTMGGMTLTSGFDHDRRAYLASVSLAAKSIAIQRAGRPDLVVTLDDLVTAMLNGEPKE